MPSVNACRGSVKCVESIVNGTDGRPVRLGDRPGDDREGVVAAGQQLAGLEQLGTEFRLPTPTRIGSKRVHGPSLATCPRDWLTEPVRMCRIRGECGTRVTVPV